MKRFKAIGKVLDLEPQFYIKKQAAQSKRDTALMSSATYYIARLSYELNSSDYRYINVCEKNAFRV